MGSGGIAPPFLTFALDGSEWSAVPMGIEPQYPLDRGLGGPQSQSGHWKKEKFLAPDRDPILAIQPVTVLTAISDLHFHTGLQKYAQSLASGKLMDIVAGIFSTSG